MFFHNFIYQLKTGLRNKEFILWMIIYPIALGTFFKLAFGNIYDNDIKFSAIKVAVVENAGEDQTVRSVLDGLCEGDDALLEVVYTDKDEARTMLKDDDIQGIITADGTLSLTVSSNGIRSTILEKLVERYNLNARIITEAAATDPAKVQAVAEALTKEIKTVEGKALSNGNTNVYDQYFYNLIAMVALFGSMTGLHISIENQGNLSALGARKCVSPTPKSLTILAALFATFVMQTVCMIIAVTYIHFGLQVDMGDRLGFFYLTSIIAGMVGTSMGFFVGSANKASLSTKNSICTAVALILCFLSGLMDGSMKQKVAENAPWFNKINPAAVICDSLFSLNIYEDFERYNRCVLTMLIMVAIFIALGFIFTRRRKYASL